MTFGFFELLNRGVFEHQPRSARVNDELRIDGMHYSVPPIVIWNRAVLVNLSLTGGSGVIRTGAACFFVVVDHVTPPMRTRAVFASECEATLSRPGLVPVQRFTLTENARGVRFGEGSRQHNSQVTCQRFLLQGCPHAGQGRAFRSRIEYAPAWFTFLLGSGAPSMPRAILATLLIIVAMPVSAQDPKPTGPAPLQLTAQQDHKRMMEALGIKSLREGANGRNRNAPNAANYEESKVNVFTLPDPLVCSDGTTVTTREQWWAKRRPEIVDDFDREVYGRVPNDVPKVMWEVASPTEKKVGATPAITKSIVGHVDNSRCRQINVDIQLTLTTPAEASGPVPVMMEFGFGGFVSRPGGRQAKGVAPKGTPKAVPPAGFGGAGPSWQEQVLAMGWGYAIIVPNSIQADNGAGLTKGIIGLCNKGQARKPDDWGALRLGLGSEPGPGLLRNRQGRRCQAGRHRGAVALR